MAVHHLHELVGTVVSLVVRGRLSKAHVARLVVVDRGDDVPRRPTAREVVERGEHTGHVEGLVVGGRVGSTQAEPVGSHAHCREHCDWVELHAADARFHRVPVVAAEHVGHRQPVIEEAEIEAARFEHLADVAVVIEARDIVSGVGMPPGGRDGRAVLRLQEAHQHDLTLSVHAQRW